MNGSQKSRRNKFSLALVPLLLFVVLAILFSLDVIAKLQVNKYEILPSPLEYSVKEYPALDINSFPSLSAKGVTVMDRNSKVVIFSKNPDLARIRHLNTFYHFNQGGLSGTIGTEKSHKFAFMDNQINSSNCLNVSKRFVDRLNFYHRC